MRCGERPYGDLSHVAIKEYVKAGNILPCPPLAPTAAYTIMKSCWNTSSEKRPTFSQLCTELQPLAQDAWPTDIQFIGAASPSLSVRQPSQTSTNETLNEPDRYDHST